MKSSCAEFAHVVRVGRAVAEPTVGAFSNLGEWDAARRIVAPAALGDWFACPPVLRSQPLGAGCVTFRGRMGLVLQAHAVLTTDAGVTRSWMEAWLERIRNAAGCGSAAGGKEAS